MKTLFVGLDYHVYTRAIIDEMAAQGAQVTYVDIQPRTLPFKVLRTTGRSVYDRYLHRHHRSVLKLAREQRFDRIVFLQAHQMALETLAELRALQPGVEMTLYNWDAISNHDYRQHAVYFDRVLTFDPADALAHGYGYLPLFCMRPMQALRRDLAVPKSLYMIGNIVKAQRYRAVEAFRDYAAQHGIIFNHHLKITPVVLAQLRRQGLKPRDVSLRSIDPDDFAAMVEKSVGAFDFANHDQSGQTMRMMENLCAGRKIVTNNRWVLREPFYSPDRIYVFDGVDFSGISSFLEQPIADPDATFPDYHIQSFTRRLLGLEPLLPSRNADD